MHSCLYEGRIAHRRDTPVTHAFSYSLFLLYVDLAELPELERAGLFSTRGGWTSLLASDHLPSRSENLLDRVRTLLRQRTGCEFTGPIRLLTQLRYFGYYFSPLNLYYCFEPDGKTLSAVVAEVNNIPWRDRYWYVLWQGNRTSERALAFRHAKEFHVSPFMPMHQEYRWRLAPPGARLGVHLESWQQEERQFAATLHLKRGELSRSSLRSALVRHGWMTAKVVAAIYWEAFRLWMKKCPAYPHPQSLTPRASLELKSPTP